MEIKTKLKAPSMPNFAIIDADKSHSGNITVDIASFTEEQAKEYAQFMYDTFLKHWKKRKQDNGK